MTYTEIANKVKKELIEFFTNDEKNLKAFTDIIIKKEMPIRLIDWFVVNYIKKNNVTYYIARPQRNTFKVKMEQFNVYRSYHQELKGLTKKKFDPCCRIDEDEDPIQLIYIDSVTNDKHYIETCIAQLNFFRWAIKNLVIDYIKEHEKTIEQDMKIGLNHPKIKGKKTELSKSIYKNFVVQNA